MRQTFFFAFIFVLFSNPGFGQGHKLTRKHGPVPFFITYFPKILSHWLTDNKATDSEKVAAIHSWMCYNIRYDVKKYLKHDYRKQTVRNVLWRKRAVCVGYADLFVKLCSESGIKAVQVPGYTKNIDVDIVDSFYLDDHMWNAVLIDSRWQLIDPTWDAGYVEPYQRTFMGYIAYIFTLGNFDIQTYHPHFVRYPTDKYYLQPSGFYLTDHLPLNPIWQLRDMPVTIHRFAQDSSYYYKVYHAGESPEDHSPNNSDIRSDYFLRNEEDRTIKNGDMGFAFNKFNHFCLAERWMAESKKRFRALNPANTDSIAEIRKCDSVLKALYTAIGEYDSNTVYLKKQKEALIKVNSWKRDSFQSYNRPMVASAYGAKSRFKQAQRQAKTTRKYCDRTLKSLIARNFKFYSKELFYRVDPQRTETLLDDSLVVAAQLKSAKDSIQFYTAMLTARYKMLDSLYVRINSRLADFDSLTNVNIDLVKTLSCARHYFFDDLDYEVKVASAGLKVQNEIADSFIYNHQVFVLNEFYKETRLTLAQFNKLYRFYMYKDQYIRKMKRVCVYNPDIEKAYIQNEDSLHTELDALSESCNNWDMRLLALGAKSKALYKRSKKNLDYLLGDRRIETSNSAFRSRRISSNATALTGLSNKNQRKATFLKEKTEVYKEKFTPYKLRFPANTGKPVSTR